MFECIWLKSRIINFSNRRTSLAAAAADLIRSALNAIAEATLHSVDGLCSFYGVLYLCTRCIPGQSLVCVCVCLSDTKDLHWICVGRRSWLSARICVSMPSELMSVWERERDWTRTAQWFTIPIPLWQSREKKIEKNCAALMHIAHASIRAPQTKSNNKIEWASGTVEHK